MSSTYPLPSSSIPLPGISSGFVHRLSCKSGCSWLMPPSTTATMTAGFPLYCFHTSNKRISAPFFCQDSVPGLSRYHCLDRSGSLNSHSPVRTPYRLHAVSGVALDTILGTGTAVSIPSRKATSVAARVADVSLENQTLYHKWSPSLRVRSSNLPA